MSLYANPATREVLERLVTEKRMVFVTAAGNNFPKPLEAEKENIPGLIIVGANDPWGNLQYFTQDSESVTITAPSDVTQLSMGHHGIRGFGGTSGATPMVSGALANAAAMLGGLEPEEALELLRKTALPTINSFQKPQRDGAGMLNAYRLFKVAERIAIECGTLGKAKFLTSKKACKKRMLADPRSYEYRSQGWHSSYLKTLTEWQFPNCAGSTPQPSTITQGPDCNNQILALSEIRKVAFLAGPEAPKYLEILSCIYQEQGYPGNATYYHGLSLLSEGKVDEYAAFMVKKYIDGGALTNPVSQNFLRSTRAPQAIPIFEAVFDSGNQLSSDVRVSAIYEMRHFPSMLPGVLAQALEDPDQFVRKAAVTAAGDLGAAGAHFIEIGLKDPEPKVRGQAAEEAGEIGSQELVALAMKDPDPKVRERAIREAWNIGPRALGLFQSALQDSDTDVKTNALLASQHLGEVAIPFLTGALSSSDPSALNTAAEVLVHRMKITDLEILNKIVEDSRIEMRHRLAACDAMPDAAACRQKILPGK